MDVEERHRAVCAIGGIRKTDASGTTPVLLMGSGYCVNGQYRIFCSCAHVWNDIANAPNMLDPAVHGVAIGFRPSLTHDRARAERGEVDWVGRAVLLRPPGVLDPPSFGPPSMARPPSDGLDFVALQLTQLLDGSPLPSIFPPFVALPLGDPDLLRSGDELTMLGFGVIGGQVTNRGNARPKHPRFSNISNHPTTGRWIEVGGQEMAHSGHSGGPLLGPRGEIVGWVVWTVGPRGDGRVDQLRPVDTRFASALHPALDALLPQATFGKPLRDRLATGGRTLPLTAGSAGHTAAAAQAAQATADGAQATAHGAQIAAQGAQATAEGAQAAAQEAQAAVYGAVQAAGWFGTCSAILARLLDKAECSAKLYPQIRAEDTEPQTLEDVGLCVGDRIVAEVAIGFRTVQWPARLQRTTEVRWDAKPSVAPKYAEETEGQVCFVRTPQGRRLYDEDEKLYYKWRRSAPDGSAGSAEVDEVQSAGGSLLTRLYARGLLLLLLYVGYLACRLLLVRCIVPLLNHSGLLLTAALTAPLAYIVVRVVTRYVTDT